MFGRECVSDSSELIYSSLDSNNRYKSDYSIDLWREIKRRWLVFGVLLSVAGAVAAPKLGAPGGPLHTEYLLYLPLSYIYYSVGCRRATCAQPRRRVLALTMLHAHVAAPALCLVTLRALNDVALDSRLVEGAMLASAGTPCVWLPLSFQHEGTTPLLVAVNYVAALVIVPLSHLFLCGRFPVSPLLGIASTMLASIPPYALGSYRQPQQKPTQCKLSALLLLYSECCKLLRDSEGMLGVWDVLATMFLEISWICTMVASSTLYLRCGLLNAAESKALLLTALPKSTHAGWEYSTTCKPSGLSQLPAVFIAPAQALILAAVFPEEDEPPNSTLDE